MQTPGEKRHHLNRDDTLRFQHDLAVKSKAAVFAVIAGLGASLMSWTFPVWVACWIYHKCELISNRAVMNAGKQRVWAKVGHDHVGDKFLEPLTEGDKTEENWVAVARTIPAVICYAFFKANLVRLLF